IAVAATGGDSRLTATPEAPAPAPKEEKLLPTGGEVPAKPAEGRKVEKEQLLPTGGEVPAKPAEGPAPSEPHRYSPGVQMAASDLKVDLSQVTGTGLGGRVTKKDVQDFAASAKAAPAARPAPAASVAPGDGGCPFRVARASRGHLLV